MNVSSSASSGQTLRLKAKGFRGKHGLVGDQLIRLKIVMPKREEIKPKQIKVNVGSVKPLEGKSPTQAA